MVAAGMGAFVVAAVISSPRVAAADGFEPRSRLLSSRAVATNYSLRTADFHAIAEAARKKHGPKSRTVLQGGTVTTTLNGKVVETAMAKARVGDVFGMLLVGPGRDAMARFPFLLRVSGNGEPSRDVGEFVRARFAEQAPGLFAFNDFDWVNLWCWSQDTPDAGAKFADAKPQLGRAELCLVRWRLGLPRTMLIGALAADGGDWVRDASRPICRALVTQWLEMPEVGERGQPVDYAGCVLVHDPDRGSLGARDTVTEHIYEVQPEGPLLAIN
jgi:hypothetical protein